MLGKQPSSLETYVMSYPLGLPLGNRTICIKGEFLVKETKCYYAINGDS